MPDMNSTIADPFERATAAAIADLQAALSATRLADAEATQEAEPPHEVARRHEPAATVSDTAVGHGAIRLRGRSPEPSAKPTPAAPESDPVAASDSGPIGHGTIRLLVPSPRSGAEHVPATPDPGAAAAAGPIGHGSIRLLGRTVPDQPERAPETAGRVEPEPPDAATQAAREELLAALAGRS